MNNRRKMAEMEEERRRARQEEEEEERRRAREREFAHRRRVVIPYKSANGLGDGDENVVGMNDVQQQNQETESPRDFFNAFSADDSTGHVSSSSPTDPHRDTGPVVLAVVLIVGVVFLFFTCITCCTVGGGGGGSGHNSGHVSSDEATRELEAALEAEAMKQDRLLLGSGLSRQQQQQQGLRRYNTAPARHLSR